MTERVRVDYSALMPFVTEEDLASRESAVAEALETLEQGKGPGADFTGWIRYPEILPEEEVRKIEETAEEVRKEADVLLVVGIGGSYLGARAVIEATSHGFETLLPRERRRGPLVFYAGQNLNGRYLEELIEVLNDRSLFVNVISKSGTTTEPGLAFRLFRKYLTDRYGHREAARRIISTTDAKKGALRKLTDQEGYRNFVIPDDIGGRYSVLTPVGLFPIAVSGIAIRRLLKGAGSMMAPCGRKELFKNPAAVYACVRHLLWQQGKRSEILVTYDPKLQYFSEWWKQLFGESEGKEGKGIFPASALFSTDLHSLGQWIQEGPRTIFETVVHVEEDAAALAVPEDLTGLEDGLAYLEGRTWGDVQEKAFEGTKIAHHQGDVPVLVLKVPRLDPFHLGQMIYFFEKTCGISGTLLGVNPFNQPGVEAYKRNMFALLGKPDFEKEGEDLEALKESLARDKIV